MGPAHDECAAVLVVLTTFSTRGHAHMQQRVKLRRSRSAAALPDLSGDACGRRVRAMHAGRRVLEPTRCAD